MAGAGLTDVIASLQDGTSGVIFFSFPFSKSSPSGFADLLSGRSKDVVSGTSISTAQL